MNSGIYALYWWEQDLIYIGLSQNLTQRKSEHFRKLNTNKHSNYKVQDAYNKYGNPDFIILEECSIDELPNKEVFWTNEFNALNSGLCIVAPGIVGFGPNSNASKYSGITILRVFSLLYKGELTIPQIAAKCRVPTTLVSDMHNSKNHLWLKKYSKEYHLMTSKTRSNTDKYRQNAIAILKAPDNSLIELFCIKDFCREYLGTTNHSSNVSRMLAGTRKSCKGFTVYQKF